MNVPRRYRYVGPGEFSQLAPPADLVDVDISQELSADRLRRPTRAARTASSCRPSPVMLSIASALGVAA